MAERGLDRIGEAGGVEFSGHQPVHHCFDGVAAGLFQFRGLLVEQDDPAVDPGPDESLGTNGVEHVAVFPLAAADEGGQDHHLLAGAQTHELFRDRLGRLGFEHPAAVGAVRCSDVGVEQPQIVVDLGDGGDGGAGGASGGALFDGDGGREPLDVFDLGLLEPVEELAGVGGERFDVAPLPLGVERVECERRFSGTGEPGDHHQAVARNRHVDILEIVLCCSSDPDIFKHFRAAFPNMMVLLSE